MAAAGASPWGDVARRGAAAEVARSERFTPPGRRPHAPTVDNRLRLLTSRTLRWNDGADTSGYSAAEVRGDEVRWFSWSHVHGEGLRELGVQTRHALVENGPPLSVPPAILAQVLELLTQSR